MKSENKDFFTFQIYKSHQEFNERQLRRLNRSKKVKPADHSEESNFFEKRRARREARRASKEIQKQEE
jgi:hypothetical protein